MGRWSQHDTDEHRLPEGFVRVAYDADRRQYTFRDTSSGKLYRSAPGDAYGTLYPVPDHLPSRPQAFAPEGGHHSRHRSRSAAPETTFHDILPAHAITTSPAKGGSRSASTLQRSQSTRVPSSPAYFNNSLHSRSKSVSTRTTHDRAQDGPYQHKRANTTGTKSGFSLASVFRSLSRSLTSARSRARREKSTDDDRTREYRRL